MTLLRVWSKLNAYAEAPSCRSRPPIGTSINCIQFRRLTTYETLSAVFSVLGLMSLYFLLEQTRLTYVQAQHLARSVEGSAYQSISSELLRNA